MEIAYTEKNSDWDIQVDEKGYFWAVPNESGVVSGVKFSNFGDKHHIKMLIDNKYLNLDNVSFTEAGMKALSGLNSNIITDDNGKFRFAILRFN